MARTVGQRSVRPKRLGRISLTQWKAADTRQRFQWTREKRIFNPAAKKHFREHPAQRTFLSLVLEGN